MPQATKEQRVVWGGENGVGEDKAERYLKSRGWCLTGRWTWVPPTLGHYTTDEEFGALRFLVDEWDYGGIERGGNKWKITN